MYFYLWTLLISVNQKGGVPIECKCPHNTDTEQVNNK